MKLWLKICLFVGVIAGLSACGGSDIDSAKTLDTVTQSEAQTLCEELASIEQEVVECDGLPVQKGGANAQRCQENIEKLNADCPATVRDFRICYLEIDTCDMQSHASCRRIVECFSHDDDQSNNDAQQNNEDEETGDE